MEEDDSPSNKKHRREDSSSRPPFGNSPVVHIRNIRLTEQELVELFSDIGPVSYCLSITKRNLALVEFETVEYARQCIEKYQNTNIKISGAAPQFSFSKSLLIQRSGLESDRPGSVLALTFSNVLHPINARILHKITKPYGNVLRISVMHRGGTHALVEFSSVEEARSAKYTLNAADIYPDCCTIKAEFGRPEYVKVAHNSLNQWDFTIDASGPPTDLRPQPHGERLPPHGQDLAEAQMQALEDAAREVRGTRDSRVDSDRPPKGSRFDEGDRYLDDRGGRLETAVLMVYGVNQQDFNCERIFNLFCCYGNVLKVKFMHTKQDTCMVQMGNPNEALNVLRYLQGAQLFGCTLQIRASKQSVLRDLRDGSEPFQLQSGAASFADFSNSRHQRFTNPTLATRNRIVRPTAELHFFNVPLSFDESKVMKLFTENELKGPTPLNILIFNVRSAHSLSGLVTFESPELATEALMIFNHSAISDPDGDGPYVLKLTYSGNRDSEYRAH